MGRKAIAVLVATAAAAVAVALIVVAVRPPVESCFATLAPGDPALDHPMGGVWAGGFLYVADAGNGAVKKLRPDGSIVAEWGGFDRPVAVAVTPEGGVLVADFLADAVVELDSTGAEVRRWGGSGEEEGEFDAPAGLALGPDGDVYVSDFYNHRVQRFRRDGRFVSAWGERGIRPGRFRFPTGIAVAPDGRVVVADAFNHRIQVFDLDGRSTERWGGIGWGIGGGRPGWFRVAKEVALDSTGHAWVADAFNGRVQTLDDRGAVVAVWEGATEGAQPIRYPAGVAVDGEGTGFVTDFFGSGIRRVVCP